MILIDNMHDNQWLNWNNLENRKCIRISQSARVGYEDVYIYEKVKICYKVAQVYGTHIMLC